MAKQYFVQQGDNLGKIANKFYNDRSLYKKLAEYNGILNPNMIMVGQALEIPSKRELLGGVPVSLPDTVEVKPPHGLEQILDYFGNIYEFIREDGTLNETDWQRRFLKRVDLPFPLKLSWNTSQSVTRLFCHKKVAEVFQEAFETIEKERLKSQVKTYGGCYSYRAKRSSGKLSTHSWGIAIDLNPNSNPMGKAGDMNPDIVEIFRRFGFKWGGDWSGSGKDPMHFQFCTGY